MIRVMLVVVSLTVSDMAAMAMTTTMEYRDNDQANDNCDHDDNYGDCGYYDTLGMTVVVVVLVKTMFM
jgi:hypothetical protein